MIYLDYNRTTPLAPSVLEAMQPYWSTHFMLPGQGHPQSQAVSEALENAREAVASLVGCEPFEIVFTGSGTEANNLAVGGLLQLQQPGSILVGQLEHESVLQAARNLGSGFQVREIPPESDGRVDPDRVRSMLDADTRLVCVQLANPVLGTIQPIREIADACHNLGVPLHCDATQAFGKIAVDVTQLRADTLSVSGHKFYGPKGSGAVFVRRGLQLAPIAYGEPREMGLRPGAENVPAWIGLGAAASLADQCVADASSTLRKLAEQLANGVIDALGGAAVELCSGVERLPNTVALEMPSGARQIQKAARQLAVCAPLSDSPPDEMTRVLMAIGRTDAQVARTLRFSIGWTTSHQQIERSIELIADACDAASPR